MFWYIVDRKSKYKAMKKVNRKVVFVAIIILLVLAGIFVKYRVFDSSAKPSGSTAPSAADLKKETQQNADKKKSFTSQQTSSTGTDISKPNTPQGSYTPPSSGEGVSLSASQSGSQVVITTKLEGYSDGTCDLTVSNGSRITSQTAQVIYQPEFSTCAGFNVPVSSVGVGTWSITLSINSGGKVGTKSIQYIVQ